MAMFQAKPKKKAFPEARNGQGVEAAMAAVEAEWKEVSAIYEKWEKGRHIFKDIKDLQAMKKRYEEARKARELGPEQFQKLLEEKASAMQDAGPPAGWAAVVKKAPPAVRPDAARPKEPTLSWARRLRAEQASQVKQEVERDEDDDDGDGFWTVGPSAAAATVPQQVAVKAPPVKAHPVKAAPVKAPPAMPPPPPPEEHAPVALGSRARKPPPPSPPSDPEDDREKECVNRQGHAETLGAASPSAVQYTASAKKKVKLTKKKKASGREEEDLADVRSVPAPSTGARPSTAAWVSAAEAVFSGAVILETLRSSAWSMAMDEATAKDRLEDLEERLPWVSPLGLVLPLEWKEFVSLHVDGGPKRSSRRGTPEWVGRVQKNVMDFLAHYVTFIFCVVLLHELSCFGLTLFGMLMQAGLILAPRGTQYLKLPAHALLLQGAHLLVWMLFLRSLYQMHMLVKLFLLILVGVHAYVVEPIALNNGED